MTDAGTGTAPETAVAAREAARHSPTTVQALTRDMVRACLDAEGYRYWTDQDGDFIVEFRYADRVGGALTMHVRLEGDDGQVLAVTVECDRRFVPGRRADLLELVNAYHREYRWPKASLWDDDGALRIDCEVQVDLSSGVHPRLLHELIDSAFAEGDAFWRWLTRTIRHGGGVAMPGEDVEDDADLDAGQGIGDDGGEPPTPGDRAHQDGEAVTGATA